MKAVIMAGGEGTRLRPMTCTIPKPMVRICGKPILGCILDLLSENGFTEASITLGYLPDIIRNAFGTSYRGMKLNYFIEDEPLGTAGGVKNASKGYDEPFLVISGDAMCDFDLASVMRFHKESGADLTIAAAKAEDPREYGIINTDKNGNITGFVEKPSWTQAVSGSINTGIYVVSPRCMELVPPGKAFDFSADLFPAMLRKGFGLKCFEANGYWCDVGTINAFMQCQRDVLDGKLRLKMPPMKNETENGDYFTVEPVFIGSGVSIGNGAVIGPYSVIDDGAVVGRECKVRNSCVLNDAVLSPFVSLTGALMCPGSAAKTGSSMFEGSCAGAGAVIGKKARINPGCCVWPGKVVEDMATVNGNVRLGPARNTVINDSGLDESLGEGLGASVCLRLGNAVGSVRPGTRIGIGHDGSAGSFPLFNAVLAGLAETGCAVWNFNECYEAQMNFYVSVCGLFAGVFISSRSGKSVKICGEGGLSLPRYFEREIEARMAKSEFHRAPDNEIKPDCVMDEMKTLYFRELAKQAPYGLSGISAAVISPEPGVSDAAAGAISNLGGAKSDELIFDINAEGTEVSARTGGREYGSDILLSICCLDEFGKGFDVAVPFEAPSFLDIAAKEKGRRVLRYLSSPANNSDSLARRLSSRNMFVRDGVFMTLRVLSIIKEREKTIGELAAELPEVCLLKKTVETGISPSHLAGLLGDESIELSNEREGITLIRKNGRLLIIPDRTGEKVRLFAEAVSNEAAMELFSDFEGLISSAGINDLI